MSPKRRATNPCPHPLCPTAKFFRRRSRSPHNQFTISIRRKKPNFATSNYGLHHHHKQHFLSVLGTGARQDGCRKVCTPSELFFTVSRRHTTASNGTITKSIAKTEDYPSLIGSQEQETV